jgi:hypothetical protein
MPYDMEFDDDLAQRRLQLLEHRCRLAQNALADARALYASLRQLHNASAIQLCQALQQVERAQQHVADIRFDLELAESRAAAPRVTDTDYWRDVLTRRRG